jgi:DegV family protein with EDD domain
MLPSIKGTPQTAMVTPHDFAQQYCDLFDRGAKGIVVIPLSSKISGTFDSAVVTTQEFPGAPIEVIDSAQISMAHGWQVVVAGRAARAGLPLKKVVEAALQVKQRCHVLFMVETLDYLYKGGRISGVAHLVGTILRFKPIIQMRDGRMELASKVRSRRAGFEEMDLIVDRILEGTQVAEIAMIDAGGKELNEEMSNFFAQHLGQCLRCHWGALGAEHLWSKLLYGRPGFSRRGRLLRLKERGPGFGPRSCTRQEKEFSRAR